MERPATLGGLFSDVQKLYSDINHDEAAFIESIMAVLNEDMIRTGSTRASVNEHEMEFTFPERAPLNDFLEGARRYLVARGVPEQELTMFGFLYG